MNVRSIYCNILSITLSLLITICFNYTASGQNTDSDCNTEDQEVIGACEGLAHGERFWIDNYRVFSSENRITTTTARLVTVSETGFARIMAANSITLGYGFSVLAGGKIEAKIDTIEELQAIQVGVQPSIDISQNSNIKIFPNPFNNQLAIVYDVEKYSRVKIEIFDLLGRKIAHLKDNYEHPGTYTSFWTNTNINKNIYARTIYLCKISIHGRYYVRKIVSITN